MKYTLLCLYTTLFLLTACSSLDIYEKQTTFSQHEWKGNVPQSYEFQITDTVSKYHIYIVLRHSDAYRYNNLWLNVTTTAPNSAPVTQQLELLLANNKKGWLGTGIDDIFDHRIRITQQAVKLKKGTYRFVLQHTMREEPLQYLFGAGIRVEKSTL